MLDTQISLSDSRSKRWPQVQPLALSLLRKSLKDSPPGFARSVRSYYFALVEFATMNGSSCKVSRDALRDFSFVGKKEQKACRDFLVNLQLLSVRTETVPAGGVRTQIFYTLLDAPWQGIDSSVNNHASEKVPEKKFSTGKNEKFSTGFSTGPEGRETPREKAPSDASLSELSTGPEGRETPRKVIKVSKRKKQKITAAPEKPSNLHGKELVRFLSENFGKLSRREMVGMLGEILVSGTKTVNVPPVAYKHIGILLSRVPVPDLIEIFNRWDHLPVIDGRVNLMGPALYAYRYMSAARSEAAGKEFKNPVSPEAELQSAMAGKVISINENLS